MDSRFDTWKGLENWSDQDGGRLDYIAAIHSKPYRAWVTNEGLKVAVTGHGSGAAAALNRWIARTQRSRISSFSEQVRKFRNHRAAIAATID